MDKADALDYGLAAMNHAMVLTGVNLDEAGKPTRWKIENSWGDKSGEKGYYVCSDSWFDQYVFQAAVEREYLGSLADLAAQGADRPRTVGSDGHAGGLNAHLQTSKRIARLLLQTSAIRFLYNASAVFLGGSPV